MAVDWKIVKREHVVEAAKWLASGGSGRVPKGRGLFVVVSGARLPAKDVARVAFHVAAGNRPDAPLKFASGQGTLDLFTRLGFEVERSGRTV